MTYLAIFMAGGVFTMTASAIGWFAYERYIHRPKLREIYAQAAAAEQRAREAEGQ